MIALALALQLAMEAGPPGPPQLVSPPSLRLQPAGVLLAATHGEHEAGGEAPLPAGSVSAPRVGLDVPRPAPRGDYVAQGLSASMGQLGGDMLVGIAGLGCALMAFAAAYGADDPAGQRRNMVIASAPCVGMWIFLPPLVGVSAAVRAGAPQDHRSRAYWWGVVAKTLGLATAVAVVSADGNLSDALSSGLAVLLVSDLVVVPAVMVTALNVGVPGASAGEVRIESPSAFARPVRDPASPSRS